MTFETHSKAAGVGRLVAEDDGWRFVLLVTVMFLFVGLAKAGVEQSLPPNAELVAPGIWLVHFGNPETFTPLHFRSAPVAQEALQEMPPVVNPPFDLGGIHFRATSRGCVLELPLVTKEDIYGFGLNTSLFEMTKTDGRKTGRRIFLAPSDSPENDRGETHAPVPFYVSSRGYGVFIDTARFVSFYTGNIETREAGGSAPSVRSANTQQELYRARELKTGEMLADIPVAKGVAVYVFAGPHMLDAVKRYNLFSGGGGVPPLASLGVQFRGCGKFGAEQSLALARQLRTDRIPCDVWGVEPGWQTHAYSCSFAWNKELFPDPENFISQMHALGYQLNFWQHAFVHPSSPMYEALKPWSGNYLVWSGLVPDFATCEGRRIFLKQNEEVLFSKGVDSVKLDECDYQPSSATPWSFPLASEFPSGLDGEQMHSLFGVLYQQTLLEPFRNRNLRTWGLVRNSHALAAPLPYMLYSDSYSHRNYVRGLVTAGFSGLLWTPEVRDAGSVEELCRRVETAVFSPMTLINCWEMKNPPWFQVDLAKNNGDEPMPGGEQATASIRQLLELRMSLVPYLYSAFNEYRLYGTPPIRAMVLDWPNDPKVREIDDQYVFGPSILVAPMFLGQKVRPVYLPEGEWYDFWSHEKLTGRQTVQVTNSPEQIPLFVKSGNLLPLARPVENIQTNTCFEVAIHAYGVTPADFILYEDDGVSNDFLKGKQNRLRLHFAAKTHAVEKTGDYLGPTRYRIVDWRDN